MVLCHLIFVIAVIIIPIQWIRKLWIEKQIAERYIQVYEGWVEGQV